MSFLGLFKKRIPWKVDAVFLDGDKLGIVDNGDRITLISAEDKDWEICLGIFKILLARIQKLEEGNERT